MVRRLTALLASLPLIGAGSLAAHDLAYRLVGGAAYQQHMHDYLTHAPTLLELMLGFSLATLAVALRHSELQLRAPAWLYAAAPVVAFAVQEHLERAVQGQPTAHTVLEPTFALGLALQLPFALLAYIAARILLRAVALVVGLFRLRRTGLRPAPPARPVIRFSSPRRALARGFSSRGPPALSS
jgi:hypothetical protein